MFGFWKHFKSQFDEDSNASETTLNVSSLVMEAYGVKQAIQSGISRDIPVKKGEIAPWFDQLGGGIQYQLDSEFVNQIRRKLHIG